MVVVVVRVLVCLFGGDVVEGIVVWVGDGERLVYGGDFGGRCL